MAQQQAIAIEFKFPLKGLDNNHAREEQPPQTSPTLLNVVANDRTMRVRGAQRVGTVKLWASTVPDTP